MDVGFSRYEVNTRDMVVGEASVSCHMDHRPDWICNIALESLREKATIHLVTTMLATSKNVLFPGHN